MSVGTKQEKTKNNRERKVSVIYGGRKEGWGMRRAEDEKIKGRESRSERMNQTKTKINKRKRVI